MNGANNITFLVLFSEYHDKFSFIFQEWDIGKCGESTGINVIIDKTEVTGRFY